MNLCDAARAAVRAQCAPDAALALTGAYEFWAARGGRSATYVRAETPDGPLCGYVAVTERRTSPLVSAESCTYPRELSRLVHEALGKEAVVDGLRTILEPSAFAAALQIVIEKRCP